MASQTEKVRKLKTATRKLHEAQEELRLRRAEYNQAVSDLINEEES